MRFVVVTQQKQAAVKWLQFPADYNRMKYTRYIDVKQGIV